MQFPEQLFLALIERYTGNKETITERVSLSGGCINNAMRINTSTGSWFVKYNAADPYPGMFETEARGLKLLAEAGEVFTPGVVEYGSDDIHSMLILEYVEPVKEEKDFWQNFGSALARQHKHNHDKFGLDHDNYIGSLQQKNQWHDNWPDFFMTQRIEPQVSMARNQGKISGSITTRLDSLYKSLNDFFPPEKPSLLHGDLWSGNFMTNSRGEACILDPAVYYGHRLMDLGMSLLFGGFSPAFYEAYHAEFPLEKNWRQAIEIANLYPLLVHVNLFGGGYASSVMQILQRF